MTKQDDESVSGTQKRPKRHHRRLLGHRQVFSFTHLIFILLTKLCNYYFKPLTTTTTERPPLLACEPLARRVDCGDDETTGDTKQQGGRRNNGEW